jgi:hypothetical protein
VSKASAEFYRAWAVERSRQIDRAGNPAQRQELMEYHDRARKFWEEKVAHANAP